MSEDRDRRALFDRAVAFHFRVLERQGRIPWQPTMEPDGVWPDLGIVVLQDSKHSAAYSFTRKAPGLVKFRALREIASVPRYNRDLQRAQRALRSGDKAIPLLHQLGLSTREIGGLLGVSHEHARRRAQL